MTGTQAKDALLAILRENEPPENAGQGMEDRLLASAIVRRVQDTYHATPEAQATGYDALAQYLHEFAERIRNEHQPLEIDVPFVETMPDVAS